MGSELASDPGLVQEFLSEAEELLQGMDEDMIALEASPHDSELLNRVFRALHTIKGTAGFLELNSVVRLSHSAEELLNLMRKKEATLNPKITDVLLRARDQLGKMLADIRSHAQREYDLEPIIAELQQAGRPVTRKLGDILLADGVVDAETLNSALEQQAAAPEGERRRLGDVLIEQGAASAEQISDALSRQKQVKETANTMRVEVSKLDDLVDLMGELVLERNRLLQINHDLNAQRLTAAQCAAALNDATGRLSFITEELQAAGLRTRMVPIDAVFRKFPRLVRDVARAHGKEVELLIRGQETELDKNMVENINDPLVHLVRNALDHGIESPDLRLAAGKPRQGSIRLEARQEGDQIQVMVSDDGAGIDVDRVSRKAVEKGFISQKQVGELSAPQILDLIFRPGFTTKENVTELSGRGVGMDVVRSNLKKLNGTIEIENHPGRGVTVLLRVPLTLATLPVLLVQVANETYALPLRSVVHTLRVDPHDLHLVEGQELLRLHHGSLPLLRLRHLVGLSERSTARLQHAVILAAAERKFALLVDRLLGEESTVMKPLGNYLRQCGSITGATISGDGRIRLVLNPAGLAGIAEARIAEPA